MIKLEPSQYRQVQALARPMGHHLVVEAMLAGDIPCEVYVDDPQQPAGALLLRPRSHRVYLVGRRDESEAHAVAQVLATRYGGDSSSSLPTEFVAYYDPIGWKEPIVVPVPGIQAARVERHYYRLRQLLPRWQTLIPDGFRVRRIDERLLAETLLHSDHLLAEIHSESHSVDDFLRSRFGFCVQNGDTLVGWCLSEYNRPGRCELGIEVLERYQRRGLGTVVASATVEHALSRGIASIGWHCWATNAGSIGTALKVGFERVLVYPVWYYQVDKSRA
jgi:RimJ/RimL family protein N-acetyltransferase